MKTKINELRVRLNPEKEKDKVIIDFLEKTYSPLETIKAILYSTALLDYETFPPVGGLVDGLAGGLVQAEVEETFNQMANTATGQSVHKKDNSGNSNFEEVDKVSLNEPKLDKTDTSKKEEMDKVSLKRTEMQKDIDSDLLAMFN